MRITCLCGNVYEFGAGVVGCPRCGKLPPPTELLGTPAGQPDPLACEECGSKTNGPIDVLTGCCPVCRSAQIQSAVTRSRRKKPWWRFW